MSLEQNVEKACFFGFFCTLIEINWNQKFIKKHWGGKVIIGDRRSLKLAVPLDKINEIN